MKNYKGLIIGLLFLVHKGGVAQKIITDRPDQTESSSTIPKKSLQIESGMLMKYVEEGEISIREIAVPGTLFRYGISDGVEIRVVSQYINIREENSEREISGIADLEIGAKIQLLRKEGGKTEMVLLSHFILPTGTKQVSFGKLGTINKLCLSHELSDALGLGYNLGYSYFGVDNGFFTYSMALAIGITDKAGIYIEPYGELGLLDQYFSNINAGLTYLIKDNFQLDFSFGTGLNHSMNFLSAGFSWNIAAGTN